MLLIAICGLAQALIVKRVQHRVNELKVLLKSSRAIQAEQPGSNRFWNAIEQYEAASKNLGCPVQFTLPKHDE